MLQAALQRDTVGQLSGSLNSCFSAQGLVIVMDIKSNFKTTCKVMWQSFYQGTVEFERCTSGQVA